MRRSRREWTAIIEEFKGAGESHDGFCARRGVNVGSFRAWLYRLRNRDAKSKVARSATATLRLLPVRVRSSPLADGPIELLVRDVVVRVHVGADVQYVAELVTALASRC
jgi:hypothetical protein